MGIASGSTPTCSPSTNSSSSEEPEYAFPPAIARSLSYRSVSRTLRGNAQFPFPPVVDGALHRTSSQATVVASYGEAQQSTATVNRSSSLATIRQSMAYLQSFDDQPHPSPSGNNWTSSLATITTVPVQGTPVYSPVEQPQPSPLGPHRGISLANITPITIQTSIKHPPPDEVQNPSLSRESSKSTKTQRSTNSTAESQQTRPAPVRFPSQTVIMHPSSEEAQNPSLSRESSQSAKTPGSTFSTTESVRPTTVRLPSQATITQASFNALRESQNLPSTATKIESQITITPPLHTVAENLPYPTSPSIPATPEEFHPHHAHFPHNVHHHHHSTTKGGIYSTAPSTMSWSTYSHEPDPRYDRLVFDYRVIAQSMHAYRHISIFRRFGRLSMANLLYYQDELAGIERALANVDREETRWMQTGVSESESEKFELRETRVKLMKMLRETLKQYYEALLLQEQIFTVLDPPRPVDSRLLAALEDPAAPPGDSSPFSGTVNSDDLIALGLGGRDSLEKLVGRIIPAIFPHRNPSVEDVRHRNLSQKDMASILSPFTRRITRLIIAMATTALMLCPMIILQFLSSDMWKLVCISLFTIVLALLVALATRGRGEAIVMVVAAYAAVLVVFVQGGPGYYCTNGCIDGDPVTARAGI